MARLGFDNYTQMTTIGGNATTKGPTINTTPLPQDYPTSNQGINWSGILNAVNGFAGSNVGSMIGNLASSILNNYAEDKRAKIQRDWNEEMMDKQNAWSLEMWNKTNEYNSPEEQLKRMTDAGLNPLFFGLDGSSASGIQSAQPLGYQRGSNPNGISNPIAVYQDATLKQAQIDNIKANTSKVQSETMSNVFDNEFKEKTMNARIEGIELANKATKEQIENLKVQKQKGLEEIKKIIEETKSEVEKRNLIILQQAVQKATEKQILELLPYQKNLMDAQTYAQKQVGYANYIKALSDKKLLDNGYYDSVLEQIKVGIEKDRAIVNKEKAITAAQEWMQMIKNGNFFEIGNSWFANNCENILNGLFQDLAVIQAVFPIKLGASL